MEDQQLPIHQDIVSASSRRLKSRRPPVRTAVKLYNYNFNIEEKWSEEWMRYDARHSFNLTTTQKPNEFDIPRQTWKTTNRIRSDHGRSADFLHKWGKLEPD